MVICFVGRYCGCKRDSSIIASPRRMQTLIAEQLDALDSACLFVTCEAPRNAAATALAWSAEKSWTGPVKPWSRYSSAENVLCDPTVRTSAGAGWKAAWSCSAKRDDPGADSSAPRMPRGLRGFSSAAGLLRTT